MEFKTAELKKAFANEEFTYNIISNLSAASNQIQALMKVLHLTPASRAAKKKVDLKAGKIDEGLKALKDFVKANV